MSLLASDGSSSWKSPSGDFAFGFRPLADGSLFLLAIWFEKIPERTIVRIPRMGDSSCFFHIDSKSFELWIDWTKGGARRGVVVWILKALEACCKWREKKPFKEDAND
ncbi:hypothetical protein AAG906_026331 [Vitis piasezkii]